MREQRGQLCTPVGLRVFPSLSIEIGKRGGGGSPAPCALCTAADHGGKWQSLHSTVCLLLSEEESLRRVRESAWWLSLLKGREGKTGAVMMMLQINACCTVDRRACVPG